MIEPEAVSALPRAELLVGGAAAFPCMLGLIDAAARSVALETYIFRADATGARFREALLRAVHRGVRVRLLVDAFGSLDLPDDYFDEFVAAGGAFRRFNPRRRLRLSFRNHRKLLCCDGAAVVGGLNIADEYDGDGLQRGWRDFALAVDGPVVSDLEASFDRLWTLAPFEAANVREFWQRRLRYEDSASHACAALYAGAGFRTRLFRHHLVADLRRAERCCAWVAYFLPSRRLGRALRACARRGRVELLLGAQTDVPAARWASEQHFPGYLRSRLRLYEYEPQVVHAKVLVVDDVVYLGSANLDVRSLRINYELLLRLESPPLATRLREQFATDLTHARPIDLETWRRGRTWWQRLRSYLAWLVLARLDPYVAERRLASLR